MNVIGVRVQSTTVRDYRVSTIKKMGNPQTVYETMVLFAEHHGPFTNQLEVSQKVSMTKKEALKYHSDMVKRIENSYKEAISR